jgi:hypothetical protein
MIIFYRRQSPQEVLREQRKIKKQQQMKLEQECRVLLRTILEDEHGIGYLSNRRSSRYGASGLEGCKTR